MAIRLTCPCGKQLRIRDEDVTEWVSCPACGVVVNLPPEEGTRVPQPPPGKTPGDGVTVPDLEARFRRREARARRRHLRGVDRGLVFHYVTPFLFLAGTGTGVLGLVLSLGARLLEWESAADAARFFFVLSGVFLFLTGALAVPAAVFGLLGGSPGGGGLGALLACLGLLAAGCLSAALLVVFPGYGPPLFAAGLATLFGGWVSWMAFLRWLGPSLRREEVGEGAVRMLWAGVRTLAVSLPVLLIVGTLVAVMVKRPILITFIPATFVAAVVTIAYHVGNFDSVLGLLLAPTGIPFALEYLNFIGGLRMLIERRS
jgi:hypothetical protein